MTLRFARGVVGMLALVGSAACAATVAPPPPPAPPPPEPLDTEAALITAELLELQDRRDFAGETIEAAGAHPDPRVRAMAAMTAARIGDPEGRSVVRQLLTDADTLVRSAAAFAAGELADTLAVPALTAGLSVVEADSSVTPATEAAAALGKIGSPEARSALSRFLLDADTAAAVHRPVVAAALIAAWRAGVTETAPFGRWLPSSDAELRWRAAYGLVRRAEANAAALVIDYLADPEPLVRSTALRGLTAEAVAAAGLDRGDVLSRILPLLEDSSYISRVTAIRTAATYGPGPGLEAVVRIARESDPHARAAAIEAIGLLGSAAATAMPAIREIAWSSATAPALRALAVEAVAAIEGAAAEGWLREWAMDDAWRVRVAAARALTKLPQPPLPMLDRLARDRDDRVAAGTLRALAEVEDTLLLRSFRGILFDALQAGDLHARAAALEGLARVADPTLLSSFLDAYAAALRDRQNDAQLAAVEALASLRDRGVFAPERTFFARFSESGDYLVRQRVQERLGTGPRGGWSDPFPLPTAAAEGAYREYVERWLAPAIPVEQRPRLRIETTRGPIDIELFSESAPLTVANFLLLANVGYFDGQEWPRVVPGFVAQGGDPRGDTSGGPGYSIRDEMNRHRYLTGTLGMALSGPDTGGSQFFITLSPQPHLDGTYTVFGRVSSGLEVAETLLPGDRIVTVTEILPVDPEPETTP